MALAGTQSENITEFPQHRAKRQSDALGRRIRVVFVIDNMRLGGTELNAVRTAERLNRERFDLRVVCLGEDGPLTERYRATGVTVENMTIHSFYGPSMIRSGLRFMRMLRREHVDIVHAHDVYSNIFTAVWAPAAGVPVLITSRRWWSSLPNRKLQYGNKFAVARSTAVLANSSAVAEQVASETSRKGRVWTITNFVDDEAFGAVSEDERLVLRQRWNAPADAIVIGCVARFDPVKDHVGLLHAFALLRRKEPRAYLVLMGDGEARRTLEALVDQLGLKECVYFAGEQRGRTNLHRGFDVSVLASHSEGFPNSLVEAMAAGNPVVATAVGGTGDAVLNEETGLLVPPGELKALAAAMFRLTESLELRLRFGRAGEQRARDRFRARSVISGLENMYARLLPRSER